MKAADSSVRWTYVDAIQRMFASIDPGHIRRQAKCAPKVRPVQSVAQLFYSQNRADVEWRPSLTLARSAASFDSPTRRGKLRITVSTCGRRGFSELCSSSCFVVATLLLSRDSWISSWIHCA